MLCARAIGPRMVARGWGRVINMGSVLGVIAMPGRTPYASSKAGIINLTRVLALEWAGQRRDGERHLPGRVRDRDEPTADEGSGQVQGVRRPDSDGPLGRTRRADGAAVYLASEASSYMTGSRCSSTAGGSRQVDNQS